MSKLISQFERDWKKKSTESAVKVVATKVKETPKATKLDGRKTRKSKPAKTKEAIAEPLMPNKKRGRPKAAEPTAPLVAEEVLVEPIQDEIEMEEDSYEDMNEVFTALDDPLDDVLAEFEMAEESDDDFLEDESFED